MNYSKFLFSLVIFFALQSTAQLDSIPQGTFGKDYNITDSQGRKQGDWMRVFEAGSVYYLGQFKNDKPVGEFRYYYESGELMTKANHIDEISTEAVSYRLDGSVVSVGTYKDQKKWGLWKLYDENGILASEENYEADRLSGVSKIYYKNGQLAKSMTYVDDVLNGQWNEYFMKGALKGEGVYVSGKQHGKVLTYQAPNIKLYEGELKNELAIGEWRHYLEDGRLKLRILYDDAGVELRRKFENGDIEEFYDSGIPKSYYEYKRGKKHGPFEEFYNIGNFVRREMISEQQGQPIEFKETLEDTQLKMEGEYRMGNLEGEIIYYDEKGMITKKEFYENGVLTEQ